MHDCMLDSNQVTNPFGLAPWIHPLVISSQTQAKMAGCEVEDRKWFTANELDGDSKCILTSPATIDMRTGNFDGAGLVLIR
jgi:hypothetical protein